MHQLPAGPLSGQHILVTRPAGQADTLLAGITQLGGRAAHIPLLAITPVADLTTLEAIARRLTTYQACIFISANAVHTAWPVLAKSQPWPVGLAAAVVGPGTARVLRELGVEQIFLPEARYDSEGLLALPLFSREQCQGQSFALIRGEGGRDHIASTLQARGAQVDEASTYQRSLDRDAIPAFQRLMAEDRPDAMLVTSSESLQRLMTNAPADLCDAVRKVPVIAPHARIAQVALALGFERVLVSAGGDDGLLEFLQTYNALSLTDAPRMDVL